MASWEIGERNDDDFAGEIIELNGFFSGKPCLISTLQPEFNWKHGIFMFF